MKRLLSIVFFLITLQINAFAQQNSIDSTLVTFYPTSLDSISLINPYNLDTSTFHADNFNLLEKENTIYSTLSNIGLAHKSMRFIPSPYIGFDLTIPSFANYIRTEKDLKSFLSLLPYSEIRYVMTFGDKEQHLNFRFGRQFIQGLFVSFEYNINYSPSNYTNNKAENNYFWINALYTTKDQRYRASAYWFRNKIDVQENGGILYDSVYSNQLESDNAAILTNLSSATNYLKVSGAGFQHYFNLLPKPVTDSVTTRKFTLGRINHSFAYQRNQLFFNETSASLPFYAPYDTIFSSRTTDTTIIHAFQNSLYWNSLGYKNYSDDIPFYLYAGVSYDFFRMKHYNYLENSVDTAMNYSQVSLNGGIIINLFRSTTLAGHVKLITAGYQIGDFSIQGKWRQFLGTSERNFGKLIVDFNMKRQSPSWFETSYHSNHFRWENDFHAATYLSFDAHYHYKFFNAGVRHTSINDLIYFNQEAKPVQSDGFTSVSELYANINFEWWRFRIEGFASLQKASNEAILHLPLLLAKIKIGYSQPIFKKAAILQPNITIQYFTKYHADAYMPALRTFYLQDEVLIGNFPYIDFALAINVKKADIFIKYNNMFLLTGNHDSFIGPHYPMRDSKIFFGVNWRLFN